MKRAEAKQKLIDLGIAEPTEEQISSLLNSVTAETKPLQEKAEKADDLQKKLDDLQTQNLTDAEKTQKENEKLQQQIAELQTNGFKAEAKAILKGAKLEDADIEALLPGMVAGLDKVEDVLARTNAYVSAMNKVRDNAIKEHDKDVLDGTKTPGTGAGGGDETKTEAEKFAESYGKEASETVKTSESIVGSYLD